MPLVRLCLLFGLALAGLATSLRADEGPTSVSFRRDVMAVLTKTGCNQGTCHGNLNGKGGFKLSLRGDDPDRDWATLTHEQFGRRIDRQAPDTSLLLLKGLGSLGHGGGVRLAKAGPEYETLQRWIAAGATDDRDRLPAVERLIVTPREAFVSPPQEELELRVIAKFRDGSRRDVTRWSLFIPSNPIVTIDDAGRVRRTALGETTILVKYLNGQGTSTLAWLPQRPEFVPRPLPAAGLIDRRVIAKLNALKIEPAEQAGDSTFVRRVYLDLLGVLPTADEARQFVADERPDKRARLIATLIERPEFADVWALKWSDLLRNEERTLDRKGVQNFHHWLRDAIERRVPIDALARALVASQGSTYARPESNFYRALRTPIDRAEAVGQVFLGVRLQCAKCHNHPFDRWTQDEYYDWAASFARVDYKILDERRRDRNDKHEFDGEQLVFWGRPAEVLNPRLNEPAAPRWLGGSATSTEPPSEPTALADWLTSEQTSFAAVMANRVWHHAFGRGLVDPIDDFRASNPPSHPELLDSLAREWTTQGFDLRWLLTTIVSSEAYQRAATANATNVDDEQNYARSIPRPLSAEQLVDAIDQVLGTRSQFNGYPPGLRAGQIPGVRAVSPRDVPLTDAEQFLVQFGKPPRLTSCDCERTDDHTLGQVFQLVSGPLLHDRLTRGDNRLGQLLEAGLSDDALADDWFWTCLARPPSEAERAAVRGVLAKRTDRRAAWEDILWSLLNSAEFLLRS